MGKLLLTKFIKMKKLLLLSLIGLFISCGNQNCETPSNGFIDGTGQSVTLGSESTVDVFKSIDKAWAERDYELSLIHI